jgi:hypothetical protein
LASELEITRFAVRLDGIEDVPVDQRGTATATPTPHRPPVRVLVLRSLKGLAMVCSESISGVFVTSRRASWRPRRDSH